MKGLTQNDRIKTTGNYPHVALGGANRTGYVWSRTSWERSWYAAFTHSPRYGVTEAETCGKSDRGPSGAFVVFIRSLNRWGNDGSISI